MLFNSLEFVFLFLPVALGGFHLIARLAPQGWIFPWLVTVSLVFYSVWNPPYVLLLLASVALNHLAGHAIAGLRAAGRPTGWALAAGIGANLALLGWFKYANFLVDTASALGGPSYHLETIILPLAISFYSFQQIAYLTDVARGEVVPGGVWRYATFVIFFPQLIAGPIVHYREMMPQFFGRRPGRFPLADLSVGLAIFALGLFKKTVIADSAAGFATPVFEAAARGETISLLSGWTAASAYTVQLYFDFSGYSDMAVGLARMFGIRLPVNFHSPLRAASIIEYWRRWHITLQQFIVSYMYQPIVLPLARLAARLRLGKWGSFWLTVAAPTVIVFVVIGLWHGAGWTFVLFGLMHGVYLATNEFWRAFRRKSRRSAPPGPGSMAVYHAITLLAVMLANVMFRAESVADAAAIWAGMARLSEIGALPAVLPASAAELVAEPFALVALVALAVALLPNTQQLMGRYRPVLAWEKWRRIAPPPLWPRWRPTPVWAVFTGTVLFLGIAFIMRGATEFIYFNF